MSSQNVTGNSAGYGGPVSQRGSVEGSVSGGNGAVEVKLEHENTGAGAGGAVGGHSSASPYLSQAHPTSAKPVIPAPGAPVPASTTPVYDPRFAGVAPAQGYGDSSHSSSQSTPYPHDAPSGASSRPTSSSHSNTIVVSGLPRDVTVEKLANYFGEFGALKKDRSKDPPAAFIDIHRDHSSSVAYVQWEDAGHAPLAVQYFHGKHWPGGGTIQVSAYQGPPEPSLPPRSSHQDRYSSYPPAHPPYGAPPPYSEPPGASGQPPYMPYDPRSAPPYNPQAPAFPPGYPSGPAGSAAPVYDPRAMDPRAFEQFAGTSGYGGPAYGGNAHPASPSHPSSSGYPPYPGAPGGPPGFGGPPGALYAPYPGAPPSGPYPYAPNYSNEYPPPPMGNGPPPGQVKMFRGKGGAARAGDWICPGCGNNNFSWRTTCKQCNMSRSSYAQVVNQDEIPGDSARAAARGPHPESHRDWTCERCNFKNFAKRDFCHDCRAAKPASATSGPVRGGGLYDRQRERSSNPY